MDKINETKPEIKDIEVDGNTVRFKKHKGAFKVKVRVPMVKKVERVKSHTKRDGTKVKAYLRRPRESHKCQRCGGELKRAGEMRAGPKGGLRNIYFCTVCGFRSLG